MSAFSDAIAAALGTVEAVAGETITYFRGNASVDLTAVPGTTNFQGSDAEGITFGFVSSDWIFKASELVIAGQTIRPQRGDRIECAATGSTRKYEVLPDAEQVYRYCDRARTRIRVHTKEKT